MPARKKSAKQAKKKAAKKTAKIETYTVSEPPEKKASDGYIKHSWIKIAVAAVIGALIGWLLRKRK